MKKIISYSLYGSNPRYTIGIEKNINIAKNKLHDWICYVHYDNTVPNECIDRLSAYKNIKLIKINHIKNHGMFWRFIPFFDSEKNICISRDTDSRLTEREVFCINEWIKSDYKYHVIRDHAQHYNTPIMGGMWGAKGFMNKIILNDMINFINLGDWYYGKDQNWLSSLWQFIQKDCLVHGIRETPWLRESRNNMNDPFNFIGNGWTEFDKPIYSYEDHGRVI